MDLTLVTCAAMPEPDHDEQPLLDALAAAGVEARMAAWDDPGVDWSEAPLTVMRSTWNYTDDRGAFLEWARQVASSRTTLRNSLSVVGANTHKSYLATLQRAELPVVPTRWFVQGGRPATVDAIRALPWREVVAKPAVGAASRGVAVFDLDDDAGVEAAAAHASALQADGDVLVQPRLRSIVEHGELDVVWIDGEVSHVVTKRERLASDDEHVDAARPATDEEARLVQRVLRTIPAYDQHELLYARVDLATDDLGDLRIVELELVEPSLFLVEHPPALDRFVAALRRESGAIGAPA